MRCCSCFASDVSLTSRTKSGDYTSNDDKVGALCGSLESASDAGKDGGEEESVDAADAIGCPTAEEASDDASEVVDTDDAALFGGVCDRAIGDANVYFCDIVWRSIDAAHNTLVCLQLEGHAEEIRQQKKLAQRVS